MGKEEIVKNEAVKKIVEETKKLLDENMVEENLKNNEKEFPVETKVIGKDGKEKIEKVWYKVSKPEYSQKKETYDMRLAEYNRLLSEKDEKGNFKYKSEDEIKEIYKERGTDIDKMQDSIVELEVKKQKLLVKLGELIKNKVPEDSLKNYREEVKKIRDKQIDTSAQVTTLLESTIETQTITLAYSYLTCLVAEKKEGDKWVKAFNSYDEFMSFKPSSTITKIIFEASFILYGELQV